MYKYNHVKIHNKERGTYYHTVTRSNIEDHEIEIARPNGRFTRYNEGEKVICIFGEIEEWQISNIINYNS